MRPSNSTRFANPSILASESILSLGDDSSDDEGSTGFMGRVRYQNAALTSKDNKPVNCAKVCVFSFLIVAALIVSGVTYRFTDNAEEERFETTFMLVADDVSSSASSNLADLQNSFDSFSLGVTTSAVNAFSAAETETEATANRWPFYTISNWAAQSSQLSVQTGSTEIGFAPFVLEGDRQGWESYSVAEQGWVNDAVDWLFPGRSDPFEPAPIQEQIWRNTSVTDATPTPEDRPPTPYYAPNWQVSPVTRNEDENFDINRNLYDRDVAGRIINGVIEKKTCVLSEPQAYLNVDSNSPTVSLLTVPVFQEALQNPVEDGGIIVAVLYGVVDWVSVFSNILPENVATVDGVLTNPCSETFTFEIVGPDVNILGAGDLHNRKYDDVFLEMAVEEIPYVDNCMTTIMLYPTSGFREFSVNRSTWIFAGVVLAVFVLAGVVFLVYDWTVARRTETIEARAAKTDALVNSLFPANVKERLINDADGSDEEAKDKKKDFGAAFLEAEKSSSALVQNKMLETDASGVFTTKPIADLFPAATVMFADIVGFTAWSSTREPTQVFTLLETTYNSFDQIARRRRVFKVETIGDCYVAAAGLPDPRQDHAVVMARFSNDCLLRMKEVVQKLEVSLGPDTAELSMRFGLHSGPVTAGVLRGEKSRFQLFGDTVNTASRIESTGQKDKIHMSMETAECLRKYGKGHWVQRRDQLVQAKGKGEIQTFWLVVGHTKSLSKRTESTRHILQSPEMAPNDTGEEMPVRSIDQIAQRIVDGKMQRLIGWNVDVLKRLLRQILAMRDPGMIPNGIATISSDGEEAKSKQTAAETDSSSSSLSNYEQNMANLSIDRTPDKMVLDEVKEIIQLPRSAAAYKVDPYLVELSGDVVNQLTDFVTSIAELYRDNPFHSFEHASHVTMSVCKLLNRVVTPESINYENLEVYKQGEQELHKYTYGITSDPICQFACALSALIHDADHTGVPNATLVREQDEIAKVYNNKSCAEQNSLDLAWGLLMEPQYTELRACIYGSQNELNRFRQLLVNSVMATDIADRELAQLRRERWDKAFSVKGEELVRNPEMELEDSNRKATIVIEHLIQASDVSHTMQHWHVYIKWNEKLFQEMYKAYLEGRAEEDPSIKWYESEIGFFDFYLIPLAKKLKECGVFGVASDEYLSYVQNNRSEWVRKGKDLVQGYVQNYDLEFNKTK